MTKEEISNSHDQELRDRLKELHDKLQPLGFKAKRNIPLTEDERRQFTKTEAELALIGKELDFREDYHAWESRNNGAYGEGPDRSGLSTITNEPLSDHGFRSLGEFFTTLQQDRGDSRLVPCTRATGMEEDVGSGGGFLVPPQFGRLISDDSLESEVVRPLATNVRMTSNKLSLPAFDSSDHSSGWVGGVTASWINEGGTGNVVKPKTRLVELHAHKLLFLTASTNELSADAPNFETDLRSRLSSAMSAELDDALINGNGAGRPLGVLNDKALIVVSKETNQSASTIQYENLINMYARLAPQLVRGARWVVHPSTIPQLMTLSLPVGTGGSHIPVLREDGSGALRMLGLRVVISEKLQALGSEGDILLANFAPYLVGMRQEIAIARSIHVAFTSDEVYFRLVLRADGQGRWQSAITPKRGSDTLSWCVTLAARA